MEMIGLVVFSLGLYLVFADIKTYDMEEMCDNEIHMILESSYQLKLELTDAYLHDRLLPFSKHAFCDVKIEPWYTWPKLMFYFDEFDLDCETGHLEFYEINNVKRTRVKGLESDICGIRPLGVLTLGESSYLNIQYVPRQSQYVDGLFSIIVTAYSDDRCPVHAFKCDNARCIDRSIRCDGYNSCGDNSGCRFDLSSLAIAGIVIGSLVGLFVLTATLLAIYCYMRKIRKRSCARQEHSSDTIATSAAPYRTQINGISRRAVHNNSYQGPPQVNGIPPNVVRGQQPGYPASFTLPPYHPNIHGNPPPYSEFSAENLVNSTNPNGRRRTSTDSDYSSQATRTESPTEGQNIDTSQEASVSVSDTADYDDARNTTEPRETKYSQEYDDVLEANEPKEAKYSQEYDDVLEANEPTGLADADITETQGVSDAAEYDFVSNTVDRCNTESALDSEDETKTQKYENVTGSANWDNISNLAILEDEDVEVYEDVSNISENKDNKT